jgi:integrase
LLDEIRADGTRVLALIEDPRIDSLNASAASPEEGRRVLGIIKRELLARSSRKRPLTAYNLKVAEQFIEERIRSKRSIKAGSRKSAEAGIHRIVRMLEDKSLRTVPGHELQDMVDGIKKPGAMQHTVVRMNQLLEFIKREERVSTRRMEYRPPAYLIDSQVRELLASASADLAPLMEIIYCTGARLSEALALKTSSLGRMGRVPVVKIDQQYVAAKEAKDEADRLRSPKNGKPRVVSPLNQRRCFDLIREFDAKYPALEDRDQFRYRLGNEIARLCRRLFGIEDEDGEELQDFALDRVYKRAHMLRASFAIRQLELGLSLDQVSKQLGDTHAVTERHYGSFVNDAAGIVQIALRLK